MGSKKHGVSRTGLTINTKRKMIAKVESGQKMADVVKHVPIIQENAREVFEKLKEQTPGSSSKKIEFKATTSWFTKFQRRSGIKHVLIHGESARADKKAAEKYCLRFQVFIKTEGYRPQQIFNCYETGLFWKRMPNRTYITKDEKSVLGHKPMKDRLPNFWDLMLVMI
ncbi:jerky protein homolog-like [Trichonephila clavipes]|nr:jerky protein homolog-like [Trichonephila clavipes]